MLTEEQEGRQRQAQALVEEGQVGGGTLHQEAAQGEEEVSQGNANIGRLCKSLLVLTLQHKKVRKELFPEGESKKDATKSDDEESGKEVAPLAKSTKKRAEVIRIEKRIAGILSGVQPCACALATYVKECGDL